jgi:hypothetical protein
MVYSLGSADEDVEMEERTDTGIPGDLGKYHREQGTGA